MSFVWDRNSYGLNLQLCICTPKIAVLTFSNEDCLTIYNVYNDTYGFKMNLNSLPLFILSFSQHNAMVSFLGRARSAKTIHMVKDCTIRVGSILLCNESWQKYEKCPKAAIIRDPPFSLESTWTKVATKSRPGQDPISKSTGIRGHGQGSKPKACQTSPDRLVSLCTVSSEKKGQGGKFADNQNFLPNYKPSLIGVRTEQKKGPMNNERHEFH